MKFEESARIDRLGLTQEIIDAWSDPGLMTREEYEAYCEREAKRKLRSAVNSIIETLGIEYGAHGLGPNTSHGHGL